MKNPVRNVVVEYKNRRARKENVSLWGGLDLKSIAREVEEDTPQSRVEVHAEPHRSEIISNEADTNVTEVVPKVVAVTETIANAPLVQESPIIGLLEIEATPIVPDPFQKPDIAEDVIDRQKNPPVRRGVKNVALQMQKIATESDLDADIRAELSFLETENASLKRELVAKLRVENRHLLTMLRQLERRSSNSR